MPDIYTPLNIVAYERLKSLIDKRKLSNEEIYSEAIFAKEFGISRTPIREALIRLSEERYIDILPNRGFKLHIPNHRDIKEAFHIRMALENYSASLLIENSNTPEAQKTLDEMRYWLFKQESMPTSLDYEKIQDFWNLDLQFHSCLIQYLDVPPFSRQFNIYMHFFSPMDWDEYLDRDRNLSSIEEHRRILDAISMRDKEKASEAVKFHLTQTHNMTANCISDPTSISI